MSSKIKVDTIENVAGSGNVSLGSGHNLVVPGDLTVDTSTLKVDSSNNRVGIGTASPSQTLETAGNIFINTVGNPNLTVKTTGAGNNPFVRIQADTNYWDLQSLFSNTNDELDFRYNGTSTMMIDKSGAVTKPLQPCFFAKKNSDTANVAVNSAVAVVFDSEIFDQNADFDTSNGTFTAPITGRYYLSASLYATQLPSDANYCLMEIVCSNRNHMDIFRTQAGDTTWEYHSFKIATLMDMDAGDTAKVNFYMPNGTQSVDITGNSTHSHTSFSGFLVA